MKRRSRKTISILLAVLLVFAVGCSPAPRANVPSEPKLPEVQDEISAKAPAASGLRADALRSAEAFAQVSEQENLRLVSDGAGDRAHMISVSRQKTELSAVTEKYVPVQNAPEDEALAVTVAPAKEADFLTAADRMDGIRTVRKIAETSDTALYMISAEQSAAQLREELGQTAGVAQVGAPEEAEIPERDLAAEYEGPTQDEDGNLLVPFDVAYPGLMEQGQYAADHILIKTPADFAGVPTREMKLAGLTGLTRFMQTDEGDWYRAEFAEGLSVDSVLKKTRSLTTVLCAEYDFSCEAATDEPSDPEPGDPELLDEVTQNPRAAEQWYLDSCGIQEAWSFLKEHEVPAGGAHNVIVAVIDTGVDYTHPDLATSMWINQDEIPNNGIDDDSNGYVDDVYGADMISNRGDPMDDNGHGTHVAGIIGAANNNEGIVGVAYNTQIMAVKAGQQTGIFNQSDVAEAIIYAWQNGADVINMSFGGGAISLAVQEALTAAYTRCVLVAAAGNQGSPNEQTFSYPGLPSYPAALSYVVGVMSVSPYGTESVFTNWDAAQQNSVEYEVYAPGERILSTFPGGRYVYMNGTSMASPIVAGIAALLRSWYTDRDMYPSRYISAQLAATSEEHPGCIPDHGSHNIPMTVNAFDGLTRLPKPEVHLYDFYLNDNDDGYVDAGDTLELGLVLRNRWGMSKDTVVTLDTRSWLGADANDGTPLNGPENQYVEIVKGTAELGTVGTYNTRSMLIRDENDQSITGIEDPLILKISRNCPNDYYITIRVHITYKNGLDGTDEAEYGTDVIYGPESQGETFTFTVRNGTIKKGRITEDEIWSKDNLYIVPESLFIADGATVTVEPGTRIQFYSSRTEESYGELRPAMITVEGAFIAQGTFEEPVQMFPSDLFDEFSVRIVKQMNGKLSLRYCTVKNPEINASDIDHCLFDQVYDKERVRMFDMGNYRVYDGASIVQATTVENSVFKNLCCDPSISGVFKHSIFSECTLAYGNWRSDQVRFDQCVFTGSGGCIYNIQNFNGWTKLEGSEPLSLQKVWENESSDYWVVWSLYSNSFRSYLCSEAFAESLGGYLACFETEEELLDLLSAEKTDFAVIGLQAGQRTWVNGAPVGSWLVGHEEMVNTFNPYYYIHDGKLCIGYAGYNTLIELPKTDGEALTKEDIQEKYLEFVNGGYNAFSGNAILNDFRIRDVNSWFRLKGDSGRDKQSVSGNWWGTVDEDLISKMLIDFDYAANCIDLDPEPWLTEPPEDVWPFVTDAYVLDSNGERAYTIGNETATFVVEFNRDMDMDYGLRVRFGAAEPYAEYEVEGAFVTPRRWEGVYTLKTTIENGTQFFRIENGRAADDHWLTLCEMPARYAFEIDVTGAMAMMMQANATADGIDLTWVQDDYDTLAGYNVYRSDKEDGLYRRLNNTVIPVGEEHFFDDTVLPGKLYYYNFTVVLSDMSETPPSGKITAMSMDTMAPNLYHTPVHTAYLGSNLVISATATDNLALRSVTLFYRTVGAEGWTQLGMDPFNDKYSAVIPADKLTLDGLEYYIEAFDGVNTTRRGSPEAPYVVTIRTILDPSNKGDVDGDGAITNKDALMIVQAINDLLNLTEEQFLRADLNGDGELSSAEALRILKYVNGKVTTLEG